MPERPGHTGGDRETVSYRPSFMFDMAKAVGMEVFGDVEAGEPWDIR